ncbi:MAG: TrpR-like protein [Oscillospiraceae bacterium]|nr:TrpR-like protein [Oscillospiraceae bacterium]
MNKIDRNKKSDDLYEAILTLRSVEECKKFFEDLCSITELQAIEQRFNVALRLDRGMSYNDILQETGASSATISRVNRSLRYGSGGFNMAFDRLGPTELDRKEKED